MNYSDDFKKLLNETSEGYIGHGNPNAKILFLGQEPAWNREDQEQKAHYEREIKGNRKDWLSIVVRGDGYEQIDDYANSPTSTPDYFSPLHPWPLQKYQVRTFRKKTETFSGEEGTARTWHRYQTLINLILGEQLSSEERLTFHRKSFHTDMSDASYKEHEARLKDSKDSVNVRKEMLGKVFFSKFPIVIAAVGNFPKESYEHGDKYFRDVFKTNFHPEKSVSEWPWINVNIREEGNPQFLIHCPQLSAPISNTYLERIAEIVRDFANEHSIDLNPT